MNRWTIGEVRIARVIESETPWDATLLLPEATAANVRKERDWLHPTFTDAAGLLRMSIHAFVIESRGKRIALDTCIGNAKERPIPQRNRKPWPLPAKLEP